MQNWIVARWQKGVLILLSVGLIGCASKVKTSAPVITAKPQWLTRTKPCNLGEHYTVQPGDTLWRIARMVNGNATALARSNHLAPPYRLHPGQILKIGNRAKEGDLPLTVGKKFKKNSVTAKIETKTAMATPPEAAAPPTPASRQVIPWHWPTNGKIIEHFSTTDGGNRGIDMTGNRGQPVYGSADGRVVYAGNALRGYGNLLIIKHNEEYLSAYAHNATLLVREQQLVKAKQKIATMGSSGTHSVRLHFEIRYKGKSVDPLRYLPQR